MILWQRNNTKAFVWECWTPRHNYMFSLDTSLRKDSATILIMEDTNV